MHPTPLGAAPCPLPGTHHLLPLGTAYPFTTLEPGQPIGAGWGGKTRKKLQIPMCHGMAPLPPGELLQGHPPPINTQEQQQQKTSGEVLVSPSPTPRHGQNQPPNWGNGSMSTPRCPRATRGLLGALSSPDTAPQPLTSSVSSWLCPGRLLAGWSPSTGSVEPSRMRPELARQSRQSQALSMLPVPDASPDAPRCARLSRLYNPLRRPTTATDGHRRGQTPADADGERALSGCVCVPPNLDAVIKLDGGHTSPGDVSPGTHVPRAGGKEPSGCTSVPRPAGAAQEPAGAESPAGAEPPQPRREAEATLPIP